MTTPYVGLSLMLESEFSSAALPLFDSEKVEILEWSFDIVESISEAPDWAAELVNFYSEAGRLLGHGVMYSLLSADRENYHSTWEQQLQRAVTTHS